MSACLANGLSSEAVYERETPGMDAVAIVTASAAKRARLEPDSDDDDLSSLIARLKLPGDELTPL